MQSTFVDRRAIQRPPERLRPEGWRLQLGRERIVRARSGQKGEMTRDFRRGLRTPPSARLLPNWNRPTRRAYAMLAKFLAGLARFGASRRVSSSPTQFRSQEALRQMTRVSKGLPPLSEHAQKGRPPRRDSRRLCAKTRRHRPSRQDRCRRDFLTRSGRLPPSGPLLKGPEQ